MSSSLIVEFSSPAWLRLGLSCPGRDHSRTRIGLQPDLVAWGTPGVPLLPSQVWLALALTLAGVAASSLVLYLWKRVYPAAPLRLTLILVDSLICLSLWVLAAWRWSAEPLKPSYFAPEPAPPNQEYYPYPDAGNYDLSARPLLVGAKFEPDVMRPLYSLFLAAAQAVERDGLPERHHLANCHPGFHPGFTVPAG